MASIYRAIYLRVHPTGKCTLSLSCDGGGQESQALRDEVAVLGT